MTTVQVCHTSITANVPIATSSPLHLGRRARVAAWGVGALVLGASEIRAQRFEVHGIVLDSSTRRVLNGALIQIANTSHRYSVRSDDAGEFVLARLDSGLYRVVVRRIGYAQYAGDLQLNEDRSHLEIRLVSLPQGLSPVVIRGDGMGVYGQLASLVDLRPVRGARVQVAGSGQGVVTDANGAFFVPIKSPGAYVVRITAPGYAEEFFSVSVKRNQVADASQLLTSDDDGSAIPEGLWKDLDQRLGWRSPNHSVLASGSEVRRAGTSLRDAVQFLGPVIAKGLRLGSGVCVYVDGVPRPGYPLNGIRLQEVKALEVYGRDKEVVSYLKLMWPGRAPCSETGAIAPRRSDTVTYIVVWTK